MFYKFEEGKNVILDALAERIHQKKKGKNADLLATFVRQFYGTMALDDLNEWSIDELYWAGVDFWELIQQRAPGQTKIRVFNPDHENDGWRTPYTVIEVIGQDIPFLVDTIRLALHRKHLTSHLEIHMGGLRLKRDEAHKVTEILPPAQNHDAEDPGISLESPIFFEIDKLTKQADLEDLTSTLQRVLEDNRVAVEDWSKMRSKVQEAIQELETLPPNMVEKNEIDETRAFLQWIDDHHFTFLGVRDYELIEKDKETIIQAIPHSGLGILREDLSKSSIRSISAMTPEARELSISSRVLVMSKTHFRATVHRDADCDYIGFKRFDKTGKVTGERRIIGLYTSAAYNTSPKYIPFLRRKVRRTMQNSQLNPISHAGKTLLNILETLPRNDLIQANEDELLTMAMGIYHMQDRRRLRMFTRMDVYGRFISCLVYVPREHISSQLSQALEAVLSEEFNAKEIIATPQLIDTLMLARIHYIVYVDPAAPHDYDYKKIEQRLIETARSWSDELRHALCENFGDEQANALYATYKNAFPVAYTDNISPKTAVHDIKYLEMLNEENPLGINLYRIIDEPEGNYRLKIYHHGSTIALSDILPILKNMGLRAISERPYALRYADGDISWINDFAIQYNASSQFDLARTREIFQKAFLKVWFGDAENDGFNSLVLKAGFTWREVAMLRTYAKYFKQTGFTFSQDYIEVALNNNADIVAKLVQFFSIRFNPEETPNRETTANTLITEILTDLDKVSSLDEDRIIRQYIDAIASTLRTNFYQLDENGEPKNYISLKLISSTIPGVPRPHLKYEIFVYAPDVEGVHLRFGKVSRGGLRWSDRREDFRTEVLGLVKAQQVKNAVIVPNGAKGGFIPKNLASKTTREDIQAEGVRCYQKFIRGLLDLTDNYVQGEVRPPKDVVRYDADDPYLVVAADKGTATFSDIANAISEDYGFWLGDAFASGGSVGYDHKKMGITARGAWESVKRHFYELNMDIQNTDFTVVGIGDMSGDVFGNGMLLSKHIKLVGAFNHIHIFVDPDPDAATSFEERQRLFNLPRSTWKDYNSKLISKGGGVFDRSAKSIPISKEMKQVFGISQSSLEPNELIKAILAAKVDLFWSGGIGTYVKASTETNAEVGDKTNDATRISANELQCKVIGEGGNLGLTQLARIEYSQRGGLDYPDFIDNSGGVNCSDKEVNIKILLNAIVQAGDLTVKQRNDLLAEMTPEVAQLVLRDNFLQTRAISLMASQASRSVELHARYLNYLESKGKIDRALEFLPDDKTLMEKKQAGTGLSRPGIAVLMCYSKILLKEELLATDMPEDAWLSNILIDYFPKPLQEQFSKEMQNHPLRREIIATRLSNLIINEMGFTFLYRMQDETGASVATVARAYMITRSVLNLDSVWQQIEQLESTINSQKQLDMLMTYGRLSRRVTRWFIKSLRWQTDVSKSLKTYSEGMAELKNAIPDILRGTNREFYDNHLQEFLDEGVPAALAHELTTTRALFTGMDVLDVANQKNIPIPVVAKIYFGIGEFLDLGWIRTQIIVHSSENHWEALTREALRDDLDWQQKQLTAGIFDSFDVATNDLECIDEWATLHAELIKRWRFILEELRAAPIVTYTMLFVAIKELQDLTQTTLKMCAEA